MRRPTWTNWLVDSGQRILTTNGKTVEIWEFRHDRDERVLSEWSCHIRNHYCSDTEIDNLRQGTGYSRAEYLQNLKFPDAHERPGPSTRAGDFGEILVADYTEHVLGYCVPRTRYDRKTRRNDSTHGSDLIGFKLTIDADHPNENDALIVTETKAALSEKIQQNKLQEAVDDSIKDQVRLGESLNAMKQRLCDRNDLTTAKVVERFQNLEGEPYKEQFGAVALYSTSVFDANSITKTDTGGHPFSTNLSLLVIHGRDMMELVHGIYERAANEA